MLKISRVDCQKVSQGGSPKVRARVTDHRNDENAGVSREEIESKGAVGWIGR